MPLDYTAAELALLDAPLPSPHLPSRLAQCVRIVPRQSQLPFGTRRILDPRLEAEIARSFSRRLDWEEDGYVFPDHPRPRVPRLLRPRHPEWAAEDDARDAAQAEAASQAPRPKPSRPDAPPATGVHETPSPTLPSDRDAGRKPRGTQDLSTREATGSIHVARAPAVPRDERTRPARPAPTMTARDLPRRSGPSATDAESHRAGPTEGRPENPPALPPFYPWTTRPRPAKQETGPVIQDLQDPPDARTEPFAPPSAFLEALRDVVGSQHLLTRPADTERFRRGWRSGEGEAEAVIRPGTLLEFWRALKLCVEAGRIVIVQAANTGLTEGSTPNGAYGRPVVIVSTLRLSRIQPILGGEQVVCQAGATLHELEQALDPYGRDPHSVIGSSCLGASVVGGVCNNSGGALVRRGPAYTELALFAQLDASGTLRLVNNLGIALGNAPETILRRLDAGEIRPEDVDPSPGAASDRDYARRVRDVDAETPSRFNADPGRLHEASGCAGRLAVFAVRLDTFPRPKGSEVLYVGTNSPAALALLRRRLLTELPQLPILGEYIHREAFDHAARYGRDTRLFIQWFGTQRMPDLFALKGWADARLRKLRLLPADPTDRLLQLAGRLAPGRLPQRMLAFRDRFEHHLILKVEDPVAPAERLLDDTVGPDGWFRCTPQEGATALLHRFAMAGAAVRYEAMHRRETGGLVALDVALRRNDRDWVKPVPPDLRDQVAATLSYGHFLCHVFHLDYVLKRGADPHAFKDGMLRMLDDHGAEYPAEHNVGHLYTAKPQLAAFYESLDPLHRLNPGIGGTARS